MHNVLPIDYLGLLLPLHATLQHFCLPPFASNQRVRHPRAAETSQQLARPARSFVVRWPYAALLSVAPPAGLWWQAVPNCHPPLAAAGRYAQPLMMAAQMWQQQWWESHQQSITNCSNGNWGRGCWDGIIQRAVNNSLMIDE